MGDVRERGKTRGKGEMVLKRGGGRGHGKERGRMHEREKGRREKKGGKANLSVNSVVYAGDS